MKVIIVGAGEVGYHIASKLSRENKDVVLIDKDEARIKFINETLDVQTLHGSGSSPGLLREAGLQSADLIVAVTDSDECNLVACMVSQVISAGTIRIARVRNREFFEMEEFRQGKFLGLSLVINPEVEVVKSILRLLEVPGSVDVMDFTHGLVRLIGFKIHPGSPLAGRTLMDLRQIRPESPILIAAIHRGVKVMIPRGDSRIEEGDLVYVVVRPTEVDHVLPFFGLAPTKVGQVFIIGGGQVGTRLAQELEQNDVTVKLVDRNLQRCEELVQLLNKTMVFKGDGTDQTLLEEENVAAADVFVAVTNDEEENVLSCLLARRLGVRHTITRINKFAYIPLVSAIGLDTMVSSRLSAVSAILRHIRRGKVASVTAIQGEDAEAIEFEALETSEIVGKPLKDIKFPRQALIAAIVRQNDVIIPTGQSVIEPQDHIIIITHRAAVPHVEKALMVKLEFFS